MAEVTEQASSTDRDLDIHLGCVISAVIPASCFLALCAQGLITLTFFGRSNSYLPEELLNSPIYRFLSSAPYLMIGTLPFALLITLLHARILFPILPRAARMRWLSLTALGAIASWLIFWTLWAEIFGGAYDFFEQLFRRSEKSLISTLWAMFLVGMASTTLMAVSYLPIASITWLALRRYVPGSHWKVFLVVGLCSTLTGFFISFYLWGTRWGWN